ncbi:hypothetical protein RhiirC2_805185, partial [Rhizophagus irregularis]
MIEISPNEKYLITYSKEDSSIVGWNVEDIDKKFAHVYEKKRREYHTINHTVVIDMNNKDKEIALSFKTESEHTEDCYCTFNLKGEFILYSEFGVYDTYEKHKIIWIYSTQTKNNKWE